MRRGCVETTVNGYRLVDVTLDVDEAERLLRDALACDELDDAARLLDRARDLWRGPTLDGVEGELVEAERLRIDGLRHDVEDVLLERRVRGEAGSSASGPGCHDLLGDLEAAVRQQPLREQRWELLMLSLYRAGRQVDALRAFQRARELLAEHLGLEPGPGLIDLERRILDHDPTLDVDQSTGQPAATGPGSAAPAGTGDHNRPTAPVTESSPLPAGTLSLLLCEIEGSVRRWETDPTETDAEIERLRNRWSELIEAGGGVVVRRANTLAGDGLVAVFETAEGAVITAAAAMADEADSNLEVKAAVHTGTLAPTGDGDYRGLVVNRCARMLELARGGQILVSSSTSDLARGHLAAPDQTAGEVESAVGLRELGSHWLRDVPEPMTLWQVTGPGLRSSFPPLRSRDQTTLPRLRSRLLGRDRLIDRLSRLVAEQPLVTLLGPGGIGKTTTAVAVGWAALGGRLVTFVDLARVDDPVMVADRLAEAVLPGHDDDHRAAIERLADRMSSSTDLVIIDNAEHVIDAVTEVVDEVLSAQLKGSFLVTSRQPLGLADEVIVGVPPLEVPGDSDDLSATGRSPSVTLFVERARAQRPEFRVADGLLPVVAHICRRLDGMPLAIELAAGRASLLSIDDIAARLDDQLRLLRQVRSHRDRRHRSLEAVVQWSVDQLSPDGREVFDVLSVMAGSFDLDGLEELLGHCGLDRIDGLEALDELYGASLLTVEHGGSRFRMLEPIRQFAAGELAERGREEATRRAHAIWISEVAAEAHRRRDLSRADARTRLDAEADQVLAALSWVADTGQADLAGGLAYPVGWWFLTRDARAGERVLRRVLDVVDREADPLGWAGAVFGLGMATAADPQSAVAGQSLEAVRIFDEHEHPDRGLVRLAALFAQTGGADFDLPARLLDEADRMVPPGDRFARALVDMATMVFHSMLLGLQLSDADGPLAVRRGRAAAATFREFDEIWALGTTLGELGRLHQRRGDLEEAEACYLESLELFDGQDHHGSHYVLTELARLAADRGHHDRADRLNAEAMRIAEKDGNNGCVALTLAGMGHAAEVRGDVDRAVDLYRQALGLTTDSIIEFGRMEWEEALARLERRA